MTYLQLREAGTDGWNCVGLGILRQQRQQVVVVAVVLVVVVLVFSSRLLRLLLQQPQQTENLQLQAQSQVVRLQ